MNQMVFKGYFLKNFTVLLIGEVFHGNRIRDKTTHYIGPVSNSFWSDNIKIRFRRPIDGVALRLRSSENSVPIPLTTPSLTFRL